MERSAWTDRRLDAEFGGLRQDVRDLRADLRELEAGLRGEMRELGTALRGEIAEVRSLVHRSNVTMIVGFLGVIATVIARGG